MSFWDRLTGGKPKPPAENLDYLSEALALGYELYGSPAVTYNGEQVIVAQALVWSKTSVA